MWVCAITIVNKWRYMELLSASSHYCGIWYIIPCHLFIYSIFVHKFKCNHTKQSFITSINCYFITCDHKFKFVDFNTVFYDNDMVGHRYWCIWNLLCQSCKWVYILRKRIKYDGEWVIVSFYVWIQGLLLFFTTCFQWLHSSSNFL